MTAQEAFSEFLERVVNLNPDRVNRIEDAQRILTNFISTTADFKELFIDSIKQGSAKHKTIIKPIGEDGRFDVDILIIFKKHASWTPKQYLSKLAAAFRASGRYEDITETKGKSRCVTIDYEGDFHVDLVPAVIQEDGSLSICNKNTDKFETTDGEGYANWFEQCDLTANSNLVPVVRLIKFLRDDKGEFSTKSIILTTIAANQITTTNVLAGKYKDIPNSITSVLSNMHDYLSNYDNPPTIVNPAMPGENFNRHWKNDQEEFDKLKSAIKLYSELAGEANHTADYAESLKLWKKLFGDRFSSESNNYTPPTIIRGNKYAVPITPERPWAI